MKKLLFALGWLLLPAMLEAQVAQRLEDLANGREALVMVPQTGAATLTFNIDPGMTTHQLTYTAQGYSGITVTVSAGIAGGSLATVGTATTTGGDTITFSGTYSRGTVAFSGLTGSGTIYSSYFGSATASAATNSGVSQGSTTSGQTLTPVGCATLNAAPTYVTGTTNPIWCTISGGLPIDGSLLTPTGQLTAVNSDSVVLASDQPAIPILPSATSTSTYAADACYIKSGTGTINDTTNHANCKNAAGNVYGIRAINTSAVVAYLRMYNSASDPTCTSSTGFIESIPIPADVANSGGAGIVDFNSDIPINYSTGISYCVTATGANTNNGAPPAGIYITIKYK